MTGHALRARFFPLHRPADVETMLAAHEWCAIFKAGTSDKTFDAWLAVQRALAPRVDVAVGFVRLPEDRAASDHVAARMGVPHRSPQFLLMQAGVLRASIEEFDITPERLVPLLAEHLPAAIGPPVENQAVTSLAAYRTLLDQFVAGTLPEERFQWAWLERLEKDASWRNDSDFALLDSLFENPFGRQLTAARLVALEFQSQLAGRATPLRQRAEALRERLG